MKIFYRIFLTILTTVIFCPTNIQASSGLDHVKPVISTCEVYKSSGKTPLGDIFKADFVDGFFSLGVVGGIMSRPVWR